jgi:hypothetical protein
MRKQYIGELKKFSLDGKYDFIYDNYGAFFYTVKPPVGVVDKIERFNPGYDPDDMAKDRFAQALASVLPRIGRGGVFYAHEVGRIEAGKWDFSAPGSLVVLQPGKHSSLLIVERSGELAGRLIDVLPQSLRIAPWVYETKIWLL